MKLLKEMTSTVANWISLARLALVVPLWIWAAQGQFTWVGWGLIAAMISDVLDGMAARLLKQCSVIGEKLDSWGDHLILFSSMIWLFTFRVSIFPPGRAAWMIPAAAFYILTILIGLIKHNHFGGAHILEGKLLAPFGYLVIVLSMFGIYYEWIYIGMVACWVIHSAVTLLHHYRPELFNKHQRSLILGLMGLDFEEGPIRYFFS